MLCWLHWGNIHLSVNNHPSWDTLGYFYSESDRMLSPVHRSQDIVATMTSWNPFSQLSFVWKKLYTQIFCSTKNNKLFTYLPMYNQRILMSSAAFFKVPLLESDEDSLLFAHNSTEGKPDARNERRKWQKVAESRFKTRYTCVSYKYSLAILTIHLATGARICVFPKQFSCPLVI